MKESYHGKRLQQEQPVRENAARQPVSAGAHYAQQTQYGRDASGQKQAGNYAGKPQASSGAHGAAPKKPGGKPPMSKKKKWTIIGAVALVVIIGATLGIRAWIRAPKLHDHDFSDVNKQNSEELADDGYGGDLPTVSGNRKDGIYTFLLVGTDSGGGNTDTIMLASYDVPNQKLSIMSIPRDTMVNVPWDLKKINSVYSHYKDGVGALEQQLQTMIGFAPDFYLKIDLAAFVELVDLIGGVEFDVPRNMDYDDPAQDLHIHLKKGVQVLDGMNAMGLIRWRHNNDYTIGYASGDIGRISLQQDFMKALIKQCIAIKNWAKIKSYINIAAQYVDSDLTVGEMIWFAGQAMNLNMDKMNTVTLPGNYAASAWSRVCHNHQSYVTVYADELIKLINADFNPYVSQVTSSMMDIMSVNADGSVSSSTGVLRDSKANDWLYAKHGTTTPDTPKDETPAAPQEPAATEDPATPPAAPTEPTTPVTPAEPTTPVTPTEPTTPVTPVEPTAPETGITTGDGTGAVIDDWMGQ